ncbi:MAG: sigma-70 family RNA polymerase sigma factor [Gammaproteobacteria bacterium]
MYEADRALIKRMLAGDDRAFQAFFAANARRLAAFATRRSALAPAAVEDIVQNTLIKAIRSLRSFRGESALFTWLCEICRHELANLQRKAQSRLEHVSIEQTEGAGEALLELRGRDESDPVQELELREHRSAVARTLNDLPSVTRGALEWKYGDGFSVEEIARMLGLTTIAAQSLLARARIAFRDSWSHRAVT